MTNLEHLINLASTNFDAGCEWAEDNMQPVKDHLDTWGPHCGAPKEVYRGHLIQMIININK